MSIGIRIALLSSCIIALSASSRASAQGTITDGASDFTYNASAFDNSPSGNFRVAIPTDHVFEQGWWFRIAGDAAESFFPDPDAQGYVGNEATLDWNNVNARDFSAQVLATIQAGGPATARVQIDMTITNNSGADFDIELFHMVDFDVQPTAGNDSATLENPNDYIAITTGGSANIAEYRGPGANAFLVRPFGANDVAAELSNGSATDFDNSGLPFGPGDFTGGFQWSLNLPNGESATVSVILALNEPANSLIESCCLPDMSCMELSEPDCTLALGTYVADLACVDTDVDGVADQCENCPMDPNKTEPGVCGCGVADDDTDADGVEDCIDDCPDDPNKAVPGACGCGVADDDTDGDGTFDCNDGCPDDASKTEPGDCGCGVADTDSDGDGTADCNDECPADPAKTTLGDCGCGAADTDTDGDGSSDCNDDCPDDPAKSAPGDCGCGEVDIDADGNGTSDCLEGPPAGQPIDCGACGTGAMPVMALVMPLAIIGFRRVKARYKR